MGRGVALPRRRPTVGRRTSDAHAIGALPTVVARRPDSRECRGVVRTFLALLHVRIHGVTIWNRAKYNNDGIDLMGTENVTISDCLLFCEDDAICFQDMFDDAPVRNITITNCVMSTRWAAIRSGGAHRGGIRDVAVSNCVIHDTYGCGIKLQISGNGTMENMTFSNIVMRNVSAHFTAIGESPLQQRRTRQTFPFGSMKNILFNNIRASVVDEATLRRELPRTIPKRLRPSRIRAKNASASPSAAYRAIPSKA